MDDNMLREKKTELKRLQARMQNLWDKLVEAQDEVTSDSSDQDKATLAEYDARYTSMEAVETRLMAEIKAMKEGSDGQQD